MWAPTCFNTDLTLTVRTDLRGRFCRLFFFLCQSYQSVDSLHKAEKNKRHDDKVYHDISTERKSLKFLYELFHL